LKFTSKDIAQPSNGEKYPDQKGVDIVTDAPWRALVRPNGWIPVLLFVPDSRGDDEGTMLNRNRFRGLRFKRITIYANERKLYDDRDSNEPFFVKGLVVVDENGKEVVGSKIAGA